MTEQDKQLYMEGLWSKLMTWCDIEECRPLTQLEKIISQAQAQDYDAKVALGWPDVTLEECIV